MGRFDSKLSRIILRNGVILTIPPMLISFGLWVFLPKMYSIENFWKDTPKWLGLCENIFRILVFTVPVFLYFGKNEKHQMKGWYLYIIGLCLYLASYLMQIFFPDSGWSQSLIGFTAPAWTTLIYFFGIGLVCLRTWLPLRWHRSIFLCITVLFVVFHFSHTALVFSRIIK